MKQLDVTKIDDILVAIAIGREEQFRRQIDFKAIKAEGFRNANT